VTPAEEEGGAALELSGTVLLEGGAKDAEEDGTTADDDVSALDGGALEEGGKALVLLPCTVEEDTSDVAVDVAPAELTDTLEVCDAEAPAPKGPPATHRPFTHVPASAVQLSSVVQR